MEPIVVAPGRLSHPINLLLRIRTEERLRLFVLPPLFLLARIARRQVRLFNRNLRIALEMTSVLSGYWPLSAIGLPYLPIGLLADYGSRMGWIIRLGFQNNMCMFPVNKNGCCSCIHALIGASCSVTLPTYLVLDPRKLFGTHSLGAS